MKIIILVIFMNIGILVEYFLDNKINNFKNDKFIKTKLKKSDDQTKFDT